jgi:hypothetical protein
MPFEIILKEDIGNQIADLLKEKIKTTMVNQLTINNGLLKKGNYYIPLCNILLIKEV